MEVAMEKLFLLPSNIIKHNNCYICNSILTMYRFKILESVFLQDDNLTGIALANAFNKHTHSSVKERTIGDLKIVNVYCQDCWNLVGAKTVDASYYDAPLQNRDMILQYMLHLKEKDFVIEPFYTESDAERVGLELYDLINGFEPRGNPAPPPFL